MQRELGHREAVIERCLPLIDEVERQAMGLVPGDVSAASLDAMSDALAELRLGCSGLREFAPIEAAVSAALVLVAALREGKVSFDAHTGGVFLHALGAARQGFLSLGTDTRAATLVPKVISEVSRALLAAASGPEAPKPAQTDDPPAESVRNQDFVEEYREAFLRDEARIFPRILELARAIALQPTDAEAFEELFRQVHTAKGNAAALGFPGITARAHAFENILVQLRSSASRIDHATALQLIVEAEALSRLRARECQGHAPQSTVANAAPLFYLIARIGGRELAIPCNAVSEVVRSPRVLAVPGGHEGWLGLIHANGELVPLLDPSILSAPGQPVASAPAWVVILTGLRESATELNVFGVPLDDVGTIVEKPFGMSGPELGAAVRETMANIETLLRKAG